MTEPHVVRLTKRPFFKRWIAAYRVYRQVHFGRLRAAYYAYELARL